MAARADRDRDRQLLEYLDLEHMTEREEARVIRRLESAWVTGPDEYELLAARRDALRRHFARRRLRVLPGGRT